MKFALNSLENSLYKENNTKFKYSIRLYYISEQLMLAQRIENLEVKDAYIVKRKANFFLKIDTNENKSIFVNEIAPLQESFRFTKRFITKFGTFTLDDVAQLKTQKVSCFAREKENNEYFFTTSLEFKKQEIKEAIVEKVEKKQRLKCEKCHCFISQNKEHNCKK